MSFKFRSDKVKVTVKVKVHFCIECPSRITVVDIEVKFGIIIQSTLAHPLRALNLISVQGQGHVTEKSKNSIALLGLVYDHLIRTNYHNYVLDMLTTTHYRVFEIIPRVSNLGQSKPRLRPRSRSTFA